MAKKRGGGGATAGGPGGRKRGRSTMPSGSTSSSNTNVSTCSNKTAPPAAFLPRPFNNNKKKQKKNFEKTTAPVDASETDAAAAAAAVAAANASALAERQRVQRREQRTAVLTHGTNEKRTALRLKLHITRTKRELETQRAQLTCWDPVTYQKQQAEQHKKRQEEAAAADNNGDEPPLRKKRGRKGPESWKLKGAARPAWQVYDFDTRYVCPHIQAHEQHQERTQRSLNLLALCRQQQEQPNAKPPVLLPLTFKVHGNNDDNKNQDQEPDNNDDDMLLYLCRDYLDLLMQLGHFYLQAKQFKSARETWLQCLELDYGGISTAGDDLMRMYLDLSRYEAAFRLGQRLLGSSSSSIPKSHDESSSSSVWIQYSTALVAWHLKDEKAAEYLEQAIRFNPFCAYYLAFWNTFDGVMEYTHELDALQQAEEDDDDATPQSSLEEAIEYCCSNDNQQAKRWIAMGGHVALRDILLHTIQRKHPSLTPTDVDWNTRLVKLEQFCQEQEAAAAAAAAEATANEQQQEEDNKKNADTSSLEANEQQEETASSSSSSSANDGEDDDEDNNSNESMPPKVDLAMFVGMFRTAMEMVQDEDPRFAMVV